MLTQPEERIPVLTALGLGRIESGDHTPLLEAALRGECSRAELELEGVTPEGATPEVRWAPMTERSWFPWIAVGILHPFEPGLLNDLSAAIEPASRGLLIGPGPGWELSSIEVPFDVLAKEELHDPLTALQWARSVIRLCPRTRILCSSPADAQALSDVLPPHDVAVDQRSPELSPPEVALRLRRAVTVGRRARGSVVPTERFGPWDAAGRAASRERHKDAVALHRSAAAFAGFLDPEGRGQDAGPKETGSIEVHETLTQRHSNGPRDARVLFSCIHLLGDTVAATATLREFRLARPDAEITFLVADGPCAPLFELCPDVDRVARVQPKTHQDLVYSSSRPWVESLPYIEQFDEVHVLDIQEVAAGRQGTNRSMADGYAALVGLELQDRAPSLDRLAAAEHLPVEAPARPYIVLSRSSVSGRQGPSQAATKRWSDFKWRALAKHIGETLGFAVVSIGTPREPRLHCPGVLELHDLSILEAAGLLTGADALVTVDNGIFHMGQALRTPLVHLQPRWLGEEWTRSAESTPSRDVRATLPHLKTRTVIEALEELLAEQSPLPRRTRTP